MQILIKSPATEIHNAERRHLPKHVQCLLGRFRCGAVHLCLPNIKFHFIFGVNVIIMAYGALDSHALLTHGQYDTINKVYPHSGERFFVKTMEAKRVFFNLKSS